LNRVVYKENPVFLFVEKPSLLELWNEQKTEANALHLPVFFVKLPPRPFSEPPSVARKTIQSPLGRVGSWQWQ
jgi:hypothetical protein